MEKQNLKFSKAIFVQLKDLEDHPMPGATIYLKDSCDHRDLEACIDGPKGTVYEGGKFIISVKLEETCPLYPVSYFRTKILHPSISEGGGFCNEIVCTYYDDMCISWCHNMSLRKLLGLFLQLLEFGQKTDGGHALNHEAHKLYNENRDLYDKTAREWTLKYATQ